MVLNINDVYEASGLKAAVGACVDAAGNEEEFNKAVIVLIATVDALPAQISSLTQYYGVSEAYIALCIQVLLIGLSDLFFHNCQAYTMPGRFSSN